MSENEYLHYLKELEDGISRAMRLISELDRRVRLANLCGQIYDLNREMEALRADTRAHTTR